MSGADSLDHHWVIDLTELFGSLDTFKYQVAIIYCLLNVTDHIQLCLMEVEVINK